MRCKNCSGNYTFKESECPFCGSKNPNYDLWFTRQISAFKEKGSVLQDREAYNRARKSKWVFNIALIILTVATLCLILSYPVTEMLREKNKEDDIRLHRDAYVKQLDQFIDESLYAEMGVFMEEKDFSIHDFSPYYDVLIVYRSYERFTQFRMDYFYDGKKEIPESAAGNLITDMNTIMFTSDEAKQSMETDVPKYQQEVRDFATNIFGFTETDLAILATDMSNSDRETLLSLVRKGGTEK